MIPLAITGDLAQHLHQALRARGFEPREAGLEDGVVIAAGSASVAAARKKNQHALLVAVCEPSDWAEALRAGAEFVVPSTDEHLLLHGLDQAILIARERAALDAFKKAEALIVPGSKLAALEQAAILAAMRAARGNTARAAAMLDISVRKVQYKLHEYGLPPTRKRAEAEARWGRNDEESGQSDEKEQNNGSGTWNGRA